MLLQKRLKPDQRLLVSLSALENTPDSALDQFFGPRELSSRQRMVLGVLTDAFDCLMGNGMIDGGVGALKMRRRGLAASEAFDWISDESQAPFSFIWCCYSLGWEYPESVKRHMLKFANYDLINLSKTVKFTIWRKRRANENKKFRGIMEVGRERIDIGEYPSRKAVVNALHREFTLRGGVEWAREVQKTFSMS